MQISAIKSIAEMTLNKRKIINVLKEKAPNIDVDSLLENTYCVEQELTTRQNNKGKQIGKNVNLYISDYGYNFDNEVSMQILKNVEELTDSQLLNIISKGVSAQEIEKILIKTRENDERIQSLSSKTLSSKYMAEAIIEGYNWKKDGNALTNKEKSVISKKILANMTNNNELYKVYEAINKIQLGKNQFAQNEIFAIIINIAINGKIGDISWKELLNKSTKEISLCLLDNKNELETNVLPISIDLLIGAGKEVKKLTNELVNTGIEREFIEKKDIKNVYIAKQIVEGYEFEKELTEREKIAIIACILDNSNLDERYYINKLMQNLEQIGLTEQEIYGTIINLGVNEKIVEEAGYGYSVLLVNSNKCQELAQYKEKIQTEVTKMTIQKAKSENLTEKEKEEIKEELVNTGIEREFIEKKDIKNVYIAKQIVEGYEFEKELTEREKIAIIACILDNSNLDKGYYINTLMQNLEQIGLTEQEIYGAIINLGVNRKIVEETGYGYTDLLGNSNKCQELAQYKEKIQTEVTPETIQKSVKKSDKKRKIKGQDIIKSTIELTVEGSGGSQICEDVQFHYQRLLDEKNKNKARTH